MPSAKCEPEAPSGGSCSRSQSLEGGEPLEAQKQNSSHGIPGARGVTLTDAPYVYDDQPRHQRQKLIVLCDGTWKSEQIGGVLTNVALLARCIKPIDRNGVRQVTEYQPGLGTGTTFLGNWREGLTGIGWWHLDLVSFLI